MSTNGVNSIALIGGEEAYGETVVWCTNRFMFEFTGIKIHNIIVFKAYACEAPSEDNINMVNSTLSFV